MTCERVLSFPPSHVKAIGHTLSHAQAKSHMQLTTLQSLSGDLLLPCSLCITCSSMIWSALYPLNSKKYIGNVGSAIHFATPQIQ